MKLKYDPALHDVQVVDPAKTWAKRLLEMMAERKEGDDHST